MSGTNTHRMALISQFSLSERLSSISNVIAKVAYKNYVLIYFPIVCMHGRYWKSNNHEALQKLDESSNFLTRSYYDEYAINYNTQ